MKKAIILFLLVFTLSACTHIDQQSTPVSTINTNLTSSNSGQVSSSKASNSSSMEETASANSKIAPVNSDLASSKYNDIDSVKDSNVSALSSSSSNMSDIDEVSPTNSETDIKEMALMFCTDTYDAISSSELSYSNYINSFSYNASAGKDIYTLSEELFTDLNEAFTFFHGLDSSEIEEIDKFADFNYYTAAYITSMIEVPKHVMDGLNGKDDISKYDSQKDAQQISEYRDAFKKSLVSFLESVGYTWDEVSPWFYNWE